MAVKKKEHEVGYHDKSVKGKIAVLTKEVSFSNDAGRIRDNRRQFKAGTEVIASYEVVGTGLTVFEFSHKGNIYRFPLREDKYKFID